MSIHVDDLRNTCGLLGELAADEIEDMERAYALLFAENAKLRAAHDELVAALREVCAVIESDPPSIADTVWVTGNRPETLLDHCRAALTKAAGDANG